MSAVSGLFTTAEKLRFDIEHNLVQLEDRATVVLQNMLQSDDNAQQVCLVIFICTQLNDQNQFIHVS